MTYERQVTKDGDFQCCAEVAAPTKRGHRRCVSVARYEIDGVDLCRSHHPSAHVPVPSRPSAEKVATWDASIGRYWLNPVYDCPGHSPGIMSTHSRADCITWGYRLGTSRIPRTLARWLRGGWQPTDGATSAHAVSHL